MTTLEFIHPVKTRFLLPHRVIMATILGLFVVSAAYFMRWDWVPTYGTQLMAGIGRTLAMLFSSAAVGFIFAILLGIGQLTAPWPIRMFCRFFCSVVRGTPLLLQLWMLYYGLGSLFAEYPAIRHSFLWPYLRQAWPYGFLSLTISFAGYEGEVMRGAFAGVPKGELDAARSYGMSRWTAFRRIWLPRAVQQALPTLNGETVLQLKSTPLVATVTVVDVYGVISKVRQDTFLIYEPLLLLALVYMLLTLVLVLVFRYFENKIPVKS